MRIFEGQDVVDCFCLCGSHSAALTNEVAPVAAASPWQMSSCAIRVGALTHRPSDQDVDHGAAKSAARPTAVST